MQVKRKEKVAERQHNKSLMQKMWNKGFFFFKKNWLLIWKKSRETYLILQAARNFTNAQHSIYIYISVEIN